MAYMCLLNCTSECDGCGECKYQHSEEVNEMEYDFAEDERIMEIVND